MSRIGKKPVPVPNGVTARSTVRPWAKGPKGELSFVLNDLVDSKLKTTRSRLSARGPVQGRPLQVGHVAHHGRQHLITGVKDGFSASSKSTASVIVPPCRARTCSWRSASATMSSIRSRKGIEIAPKPTEIVITGIDKQRFGQVAAEIRAFRPPEPYKGKGVKYAEERSSAKKARRSKEDANHRQGAIQLRCRRRPRPPFRSRRWPTAVRACRFIARRRTSMRRSSTMRRPHACRCIDARKGSEAGPQDRCRCCSCGRSWQAGCRARQGRRQGSRVRPRRLHLSRPRQGARRCSPRRRAELLTPADDSGKEKEQDNGQRRSPRQPR
jgi:large subunit ribosomal protein L6